MEILSGTKKQTRFFYGAILFTFNMCQKLVIADVRFLKKIILDLFSLPTAQKRLTVRQWTN